MLNEIIQLWKPIIAIRNAGFFDVAILAVMVVFYFFKYKVDQIDLRKQIESHNCRATEIVEAIDKIDNNIQDINLALVREHINKAEVTKEIWELVRARLNETADITFNNAILNACPNCPTDICNYFMEFSQLVQTRRKESFHLWEAQAIPRSILTIIEQIDTVLYPKVTEQYIPDIISICNNKEYSKNLTKEVRIELIKSKVEAIKEKVKRDWEVEILRRINLI